MTFVYGLRSCIPPIFLPILNFKSDKIVKMAMIQPLQPMKQKRGHAVLDQLKVS